MWPPTLTPHKAAAPQRTPDAAARSSCAPVRLRPPLEPAVGDPAVTSGEMVEYLFDENFSVSRLDPDGKKFDKVTRVEAHNEQVYMQLDVATEIFPLRAGDKFNMVIAPTLNLDGTPDTGYYTQAGRKTLADKFDYVMHGKLYKISDDSSTSSSTKVEIYASFGGLLLLLRCDSSSAASFELDQRLFLLIRKL
ncbi:hypothetical protein SETIT_4G245900v2 [Setaria italica]|uniref:Uncharacterized protein n=3 Tax=Setaria TaxID=4554 RepID=A0A368QZQ6_SETIT|nr:hypothetical protein SETIT_4G245900v2 [Setaria italica]